MGFDSTAPMPILGTHLGAKQPEGQADHSSPPNIRALPPLPLYVFLSGHSGTWESLPSPLRYESLTLLSTLYK
jgi:hypothetical protein